MGCTPSFAHTRVVWNVLPWPLPPHTPRIRGTLMRGRSMKFLAMCTVILSMNASEM